MIPESACVSCDRVAHFTEHKGKGADRVSTSYCRDHIPDHWSTQDHHYVKTMLREIEDMMSEILSCRIEAELTPLLTKTSA